MVTRNILLGIDDDSYQSIAGFIGNRSQRVYMSHVLMNPLRSSSGRLERWEHILSGLVNRTLVNYGINGTVSVVLNVIDRFKAQSLQMFNFSDKPGIYAGGCDMLIDPGSSFRIKTSSSDRRDLIINVYFMLCDAAGVNGSTPINNSFHLPGISFMASAVALKTGRLASEALFLKGSFSKNTVKLIRSSNVDALISVAMNELSSDNEDSASFVPIFIRSKITSYAGDHIEHLITRSIVKRSGPQVIKGLMSSAVLGSAPSGILLSGVVSLGAGFLAAGLIATLLAIIDSVDSDN